jgi:CheY-like chemotaxis protein
VRHTSKGRVLLGCRHRGGKVRIEVWDSGIGIAEEHLGRIFEEYFQLGNPARDRAKGLGLGLAIVNRIARILDHKIEVRSRPDKGSLFAIEVARGTPVAMEAARSEIASEHGSIAGHRVLVVEDDSLVMEWTTRLLNSWGLEIECARNSATALKSLTGSPSAPRIIIADYRLPGGVNGLELVVQARTVMGQHIPAVITTGDTSPELSRACTEADCALLHKPVAPAKLRSLLRWLLDERRSA